MPIITERLFKEIATQTKSAVKSETQLFHEKLIKNKGGKKIIFLSHSHSDKELIAKAIPFFEDVGWSIYVDWRDESMPHVTDQRTAKILRDKIHDSNFFVLLASNSALLSKWCNWELGLGDALKSGFDKIAIFPLANDSGQWIGQEYLGLYPHIEAANTEFVYVNYFHLCYPNGTKIRLEQWFNKIGAFG